MKLTKVAPIALWHKLNACINPASAREPSIKPRTIAEISNPAVFKKYPTIAKISII